MKWYAKRTLLLGALGFLLTASFLIVLNFADLEDRQWDVQTIAGGVRDFEELSQRFQTLAQEQGALAAYDVLRYAPLPQGTDLHLLGHVVGDELYAQEGIRGIFDCTQEFRNACSHSVVIGVLTEKGEEGLAEIRDACTKAPGGSGAYTMCFHGLGHGVFAAQGYDLEKTALFCEKTGTPQYHDREYEECFGGAVMELMGGGGHDRETWLIARKRYLSPDNPLAPCANAVVPAELKDICYMYLSPHLFEAAGADLARPLPSHFATAFTYCDQISASEPSQRNACFGGIGKEFPALALERDIRAIEKATPVILETLWSWCALAPHDEGRDACAEHVLNSLFWGGENDPHLSVNFCRAAPVEQSQERCFSQTAGLIRHYITDENGRRDACSILPQTQRDSCSNAIPLL